MTVKIDKAYLLDMLDKLEMAASVELPAEQAKTIAYFALDGIERNDVAIGIKRLAVMVDPSALSGEALRIWQKNHKELFPQNYPAGVRQ